jgi:2-amino-4-hydroxy-6-hydroxymethyldihydropteridine diphosphokinase
LEHRVYLALGTNLGDRPANLREAIAAFPPSILHRRSSRIYETPPWGYTDQPAFLNMAVECGTYLDPESLLGQLKQIETRLGRQQTFRWGPRLIDIDILFYDDLILETESLTVPHPRLHGRAFVLVPLAEIAPDFVHPVLRKTVTELLAGIDAGDIRPYE